MNFDIIQKILDTVGVYNFDPSDIDFIISGYALSDITGATITPNAKVVSYQGIDPLYHTYAKVPSTYKISFTLLQVCKDVRFMEDLQRAFDRMGGSIPVTIKSNGRFIGQFKCYFESDSADVLGTEANDKSYDLVAVKLPDVIQQGDFS